MFPFLLKQAIEEDLQHPSLHPALTMSTAQYRQVDFPAIYRILMLDIRHKALLDPDHAHHLIVNWKGCQSPVCLTVTPARHKCTENAQSLTLHVWKNAHMLRPRFVLYALAWLLSTFITGHRCTPALDDKHQKDRVPLQFESRCPVFLHFLWLWLKRWQGEFNFVCKTI